MERVLLTLAIVAFFLLCVFGMWLGWRRKARSQSVQVPPFPSTPSSPEDTGERLLAPAEGLYVSTTRAGHWQDRIVTRGAGLRTSATWRLYEHGVEVERVGAPGFWIPAESLVDIRLDSRIAGKVMATDSLLVFTWKLGDIELDTGFRGDELSVYPQWIEAVQRLAKLAEHGRSDSGEVKGGA
ncbi:transporter [Amycolatopsis minnesotensis]|uniref:Transporter n=1 Tax=Amycolatopsis minnesotensis TaxID=337894 RepID=A0ABP5DZC4_9PSEU